MGEISAFDRAVAALGALSFDIEGRTAPLNGWLDRSDIEEMVRTVLVEIREPSYSARSAGVIAAWQGADLNDGQPCIHAGWTAMIDAMIEKP